jgi:hypothetical protein
LRALDEARLGGVDGATAAEDDDVNLDATARCGLLGLDGPSVNSCLFLAFLALPLLDFAGGVFDDLAFGLYANASVSLLFLKMLYSSQYILAIVNDASICHQP